MAGRPPSTPETIAQRVYDANPHLDANRDGYAVRRLAELYRLIGKVHARLGEMASAPFVGSGGKSAVMDEYHKLYADVLRLEQELGVTYAARYRLKMADAPGSGDADRIGGLKA